MALHHRLAAAALLFASAAHGTIVPRLPFDKLVDNSEVVVHGRIVSSWSAWDPGGRYIWTHHRLLVDDALKASGPREIVVSEPGGVIGNVGMRIAGAVPFAPGEEVVVFLYRTPVGYLRTTGWCQGKYSVMRESGGGRVIVRQELEGVMPARAGVTDPGEGIASLAALKARVQERLRRNRGGEAR
ncbi:MAG: hypothetical protein KIT09_19690 [Bryobacteraceae bacterium]|nr:hypothetical protein [Bryobacteraceae bacterium]